MQQWVLPKLKPLLKAVRGGIPKHLSARESWKSQSRNFMDNQPPIFSKGVNYTLLSALLFSFMWVCVKMLHHLPASEIVFFRALFSVTVSYAWLRKLKVPVWGNNRKALWLRGVFGTASLIMQFYVVHHIPLASASLLHYVSPIFTALLAWWVLGERLFKIQWLFFAISFLGVAFIKGFDNRVSTFYFLLGLAAALLAGAAYTTVRKLKDTEHPLVIMIYFPLIALPVAGTLAYFDWTSPVGRDWFWLLGVGLFTQAGQYYMTLAYQVETAAKVASTNYVGILYVLVLGYWLFGESFNWQTYLGMVLVIAGVLLNMGFRQRLPGKGKEGADQK